MLAAPFPAGWRFLQTTAQIVVAQATFLNVCARVGLPIAVSGDVLDTQIDAQKSGQPVAISQSLVEELLQRNLVRCFPGKRFTRQPVSRRVEGTHRLPGFRDLI